MNNMKIDKVTKSKKKITISSLFVIFQNFDKFANFYIVNDFLTEFACPTHSHQLLFSWPGDTSTAWCFQTMGFQS